MLFGTPVLHDELDVLELIASSQHELRWIVREPRRWSGSLRRVTQARSIQGSNSITAVYGDAEIDLTVGAIAPPTRSTDRGDRPGQA